MKHRDYILIILLISIAIMLFILDLMIGDTPISIGQVWASIWGVESDPIVADVVTKIRLTRALVAVVAGAALAVAGVEMQTIFRNPLAEPYLLGVSAGAGLGVSIYLLGFSILGTSATGGWMSGGVAGAAWIGSMAVMVLMMSVSHKVKDIMVVLVLGMMLGSAIGAVVMILQYLGSESALKAFVVWTMGSLGDVTATQLMLMAGAIGVGLVIAVVLIKPLNTLLLGEYYARTMGLKISSARTLTFLSTTLLAGSVTAFCGPIGFVGLAIPHIARILFRTADHAVLIPASAILGVVVMLGCDAIAKSLLLPINAITALIGIPIVVLVIIRNRSISK